MKVTTSTPTPRVMMTIREAVHHVLSESKDSLSAAEVRVRYTALTGRRLDPAAVNKELKTLIAQGKAFARTETDKERLTRANGALVKGRSARLYSTKNPVPKRVSALSDIVLGDGQASSIVKNGLGSQSSMSARAIDEVTKLVRRVEQLEAQLAEARRIISK